MQVLLKNLPPNTALMEEIMAAVKKFLVGEGLLAGESSLAAARSTRRLGGENVGQPNTCFSFQVFNVIVVCDDKEICPCILWVHGFHLY